MVALKQIQDQHLPLIGEWAQREDLAEFFRRIPPYFTWSDPVTAKQTFQGFHLVCEDEVPVGLVFLGNFDSVGKKAELGIVLVKELCTNRARVAYESCRQAAEYFFDHLGHNKLFCLVLTHRRDIAKLLCRFNFKNEGTLRANTFWRGQFHDELVFGLTKDDFRRIG